MDVHLGQREYLLEMLTCEYFIPEELCTCVKDAIRKHATKNYAEESIDAMVKKPQSLAASISLVREKNLSLFRGKFAEWLACIEYNALKNKGAVYMTIINPDPTSKADLLHIIKTGDRYVAVAGPDIKCGQSTYVLEQYKKIVNDRYNIPMVDMDGALTTEEGLRMLRAKQRDAFEQLRQQHPNKKPIPSEWGKQDIHRLMLDYLKYVDAGVTPADEDQILFDASSENRKRLKDKLFNASDKPLNKSDWEDFCKKSIQLPYISVDYLNPMTSEKAARKLLENVIRKKARPSLAEKRSNAKPINPDSRYATEVEHSDKPKQKGIFRRAIESIGSAAEDAADFLGFDSPAEMGIATLKGVGKALLAIAPAVIEHYVGERRPQYKHPSNSTSTLFEETRNEEAQTHSSPKEHIVPAHGQTYHTKDGPIYKDKKEYKRGKSD